MSQISNPNNKIPTKCPSTQDQKPPKIVVVGAGVIGTCSSYYLSKRIANVTLIEQRYVACAASGKAGGFLALDWCDDGPLMGLARASFGLHQTLAQELDGPNNYGYRPVNTISLSVTESHKMGRKVGSSVPEWVDGPVKKAQTIGTPATTAQVHPQLFTETLLAKATSEYGVAVVIGKVVSVDVVDGTATAVVLDDGQRIEADAVVLALGPWSGKLSILSSIFSVYGLKAHSIVLEPKDKDVISPHALFLSFYPVEGGKPLDPEVYPRPTGEVYVCGMSSQVEVPDDPEQVIPDPESISALKKIAKTVSSHLDERESATLKAEQACFLPCTDDSIPVIGEVPGVKGCYVATGHNCWGILNGPATGFAVAELVLDGVSKLVDISAFSAYRFMSGTCKK